MEQQSEDITMMEMLKIGQVAKILGLGRSKVYDLIANHGLPIQRFGRAVRVSPHSLQLWLQEREEQDRPDWHELPRKRR